MREPDAVEAAAGRVAARSVQGTPYQVWMESLRGWYRGRRKRGRPMDTRLQVGTEAYLRSRRYGCRWGSERLMVFLEGDEPCPERA